MNQIEKMRHISSQEFVHFGMQDVAYIRSVTVNEEPCFAICAADGTEIAVMSNRELAVATIRQHELEPLSIH